MSALLLLEDNESLGTTLTQRLGQEGYEMVWARTIAEARRLCHGRTLDLAIIDVTLPDGDGFEFAEEIFKDTPTPFLFLTAMTSAEDRLKGFELGGADYIPKPFHLKELLLRIAKIVKEKTTDAILCGAFTLHPESLSIRFRDGTTQFPQARDFKLLKLLVDQAPKIVSRAEILQQLWGNEGDTTPRTVDNSILRLRQLLGAHGEQIRSVRGIGYQWSPK